MIKIHDIAKLRYGEKVHYQPSHYSEEEWENGMVKDVIQSETHPNHVRVVYHCDGDWENFFNYTGALTDASDLHYGWKV